jgi:hypothetical protein
VKVEMLVGDVGEDRHVVVAAGDPLQGKAVRAGLDDHVLDPRVAHPRQLLLDLECFQRGLPRLVGAHLATDTDVDRAHRAGPPAGTKQHLLDHGRGGGFSIRPGDADDDHGPGRMPKEGARDQCQGKPRIGDHHLRPAGANAPLYHGHRRTVPQRRFDVAMAVGVLTGNRDEAVAGTEAS